MQKSYVEERDGGYWIGGTRISLDSIVYAFKPGAAPESIKGSFPLLTLEKVYGAIAFYLSRRDEIDSYLERSEKEFEAQARQMNEEARASKPELFKRLEKARQQREVRRR